MFNLLHNLSFYQVKRKKLVEEVFNNAIDCLSDEDKTLPQVKHCAVTKQYYDWKLCY